MTGILILIGLLAISFIAVPKITQLETLWVTTGIQAILLIIGLDFLEDWEALALFGWSPQVLASVITLAGALAIGVRNHQRKMDLKSIKKSTVS